MVPAVLELRLPTMYDIDEAGPTPGFGGAYRRTRARARGHGSG